MPELHDGTADAGAGTFAAGPAPLFAPLAAAGLPAPRAADDHQDDPFAPLLHAAAAATTGVPARLPRHRLLERVARSAGAARSKHTCRHADTVPTPVAEGVIARALYRASALPRRRGEPEAVTLLELAPGARWAGPGATHQRDWLVLRGSLTLGDTPLATHDYHVAPAGAAGGPWHSERGALLYQREAQTPPGGAPVPAQTQRTSEATWADYAPGIKRRLLWQHESQAAMLYHALPGAAVPHHSHEHDEECLMLAGDFFLDEVLLRQLDYQIAPAGSEHHTSNTDTGVLIYAHGDLDLALK